MKDQLPYIFAAMITGSLIAGGTNVLAILMLFRPHKPLFIGRYRLPFTPGLIPGKQKQLAEKIAAIVAEHLLTPESITASLRQGQIEQKIKDKLYEYWEHHVSSQVVLGTYLDKTALDRQRIEAAVVDMIIRQCGKINQPELINAQLEQLVHAIGDRKINQVLPETMITAVDQAIEQFVNSLIKHLDHLLQDKKTGVILIQMLDETLAIKNTLIRKLFLNIMADENILQQITQKLQKFLTSEAVIVYCKTYLSERWQMIHETDIASLQAQYPEQSEHLLAQITHMIHGALQNGLQSEAFRLAVTKEIENAGDRLWNMPVASLLQMLDPYKDTFIEQISCKAAETLQIHGEEIIRSINIHEIVEQQVAAFPSRRLEEIILQIARKELQYITLIGALIGAILGIVQFMLASSAL